MNQAIELLRERAQESGGDALLEEVAEELARMRILAGDAYEAWEHDRDARVGKLLRAMGDDKFCLTYRPDLWPPNASLDGRAAGFSAERPSRSDCSTASGD